MRRDNGDVCVVCAAHILYNICWMCTLYRSIVIMCVWSFGSVVGKVGLFSDVEIT